ncbi:MAG TPA: aldehyde dehydrogenase family protein [Pseudonocardiaceae bacterium]|nr:aldehyde dehydrogenase family protein [Pseudonocardiaceae bacterium]
MSDLDAIEVRPRPCWIAGRAEQGERILTVRHPHDGTEVADVAVPSAAQVDRAVAAAHDVAREFAALHARTRAAVLSDAAELITDRAEEIAETITAENGKPLSRAHAEVRDAVAAFRFAAQEAGQLDGVAGELLRPGLAVVRRRPRGPVLAITPSTFPLRLVAHHVAAAIAVGAPVLVKPSSATPMTALLLGEILAETVLPAGALSVLPVAGSDMAPLVADDRLPVVTFTGSASAGWSIVDALPRKHVVAALDGGSTVVVCQDWASDTDLDNAAGRIANDGGVRWVVVASAVADRFAPRLVNAVSALRTGDPHDPDVDVSVAPTVLLDGATGAGPTISVSVVDGAVFAGVTGQRVGVFTHDLTTAFDAAALVDAADLVIGGVPPAIDRQHVRATMVELTVEQALRIG